MKERIKIEPNKVINQLIKDQSYQKNYDSLAIIGALIRKKRLDKNLTLNETSNKICSISYLSKIESNKVTPNDNCLRMLMEKLDISKNEVIILENSEALLKKAIEYFKYLNIKSYEALYELVKDVENNQTADVIKIGYYILVGEYDEARIIIKQCIDIIGTFNGLVIRWFTLFMCEYFLAIGDYEEIDKPIESLLHIDIDYELLYLLRDFLFRFYIRKLRSVSATRLYSDLVNHFSESNNYNRLDRIKKEYLKLLFESKEYSLITTETVECIYLGDFTEITDETNYIYGISYYKIGKMVRAKEHFDEIKKDSIYYKKSLFYLYELSGNKGSLLKEIKKKSSVEKDFYYIYFLNKIGDSLNEEMFTDDEFIRCYKNSDSYERIILLNYKKDYYLTNFKYKEVSKINLEIDKLRS